ncbi:hypothetical protein [Mesobacillus foraminis]|uniref:hypothetical protein n=1 Tax=Mesobacillus foraminis TaxID=279826 RepID=UPI000EF4C59D|nr:hypothetical protein [Mesobacillus foraminis]
MGYILPVTNYQYKQYAERETMVDSNPVPLTHVARIPRIKAVESTREQEYEVPKRKQNPQHYRNSKVKMSDESVERVYSEVTGKGWFFSETI